MPRLRRWEKRKCSLLIPALTRWANLCRAYGAGRNANAPFSSQRLRAGLKYVAPTALEEGGACLRRDLSRRGGVRRVRRASGGPGGRECGENPGPDGRPCACCIRCSRKPGCGKIG